jgi:hypothetical protein
MGTLHVALMPDVSERRLQVDRAFAKAWFEREGKPGGAAGTGDNRRSTAGAIPQPP